MDHYGSRTHPAERTPARAARTTGTGTPGKYVVRKAKIYLGGPLKGRFPNCSTNMNGPHHPGPYDVQTPKSHRWYCWEHMRPAGLKELVRGHNIREARQDWTIEYEEPVG